MRQWSYLFVDEGELARFVRAEEIDRYETILVQVNSGLFDVAMLEKVRRAIANVLPHAYVSGMTSAMQIHEAVFHKERVVMAITAFEKSRLSQYAYQCPSNERYDYGEIIEALRRRIDADTRGILIVANTMHFNVEGFIKTFNRHFAHIPLFGGIASNAEGFSEYVVFCKERIYEEEGMIFTLLHGESLQVSCNYFFDWEPIGREFTVTKANGRYLYELDGELIIDVYRKYFGPLDKMKLTDLALAHPLIRRPEDFGTVARALLEPASDGGFYSGEFIEGEKVQIGFGHYKRMINHYELIPHIYRDLPVETVWFFICVSYQYGYLDLLSASANFFKEHHKIHASMTFGEFIHHEGNNRFLNYSLSRVALTENPDARFALNDIHFDVDGKDELLATLSTLISSSSREIMDLNRHLEQEVLKRTGELANLNEELEKRIEQEVRKNREKDKMLFHQSKLAAMGEMINNIAHQWRQPLNIIALVMQDLSLKSQMGALQTRDILQAEKKVNDTLKYLSDTIDDFRNFASQGLDYSHPGAMEICKTVNEAVRLVSIILEDEKIALNVSLPEQEALVKGSPNDLKQVLLNLIYNAIDVFRERKIDNPMIKIKVKLNKRRVVVTVRDNGGGIIESILEKIFEPYFTTKYQARGTGLGLYMSKMIVEKRLGGEIHARNTRCGAAFWIDLPIMA